MGSKLEDNTLTLYLEGRLGVENAQTVQDELMDAVSAAPLNPSSHSHCVRQSAV